MREEYEKLTVTHQPKKQMKAAKSEGENTIIMEEEDADISSASKHGKVLFNSLFMLLFGGFRL